MTPSSKRFLLLQVREPGDPMAANEASAFRRALGLEADRLEVFDLLADAPGLSRLRSADAVLIGGSGDHSVVRGGPWLAGAMGAMELLYEHSIPTFASCWGFQGLAMALGGRVVTDHARAEVGVLPLDLTDAGRRDPVFGPIGSGFPVVIGHEDIVDELPPGAVSLASSSMIENEALKFVGKPIYATQFHPELIKADLIQRIAAYPPYLPLTGARSLEELRATMPETPGAAGLLRRFVEEVVETPFDRRLSRVDGTERL